MDEQGKIYWHSAHHEALQLELYEYRDALEFIEEHELSKEALRMDTLVIKKIKDVQISKNIGKIFRTHNIVEYKSEKDNFSFWDYQKVLGYAFIYSSFEKVQISDITITISLTIYPRELIKTLENNYGFKIRNMDNGIHYVDGGIVPIQVLESKNLSENENLFLRNLRSNLTSKDIFTILKAYKEQRQLNEKNVFIDRLAKANSKSYKEAFGMFTEDMKELFLEGADEYGWLNKRYDKIANEVAAQVTAEQKITMAKKMLMIGISSEKVIEVTELSPDTILSMAHELDLKE